MSISTVDKLPSTPVFVSSARTRLIWIVIWTATELLFVAIVLFAGKKDSVVHILTYVGLEAPVLIRAKTWRRSRFSHRHDMKIYQVLIVARRVGLEFVL